MNDVPVPTPRRLVEFTIDDRTVRVSEGSTILDACHQEGIDTPTLLPFGFDVSPGCGKCSYCTPTATSRVRSESASFVPVAAASTRAAAARTSARR